MKVGVDQNSCSYSAYSILKDAFQDVHKFVISPLSQLRIIKNKTELEGIEKALQIESASLISFYAHLEKHLSSNQEVQLFEHEANDILNIYRKKIAKNLYLSNSFPMIMGSAQNGAIIHYRPV